MTSKLVHMNIIKNITMYRKTVIFSIWDLRNETDPPLSPFSDVPPLKNLKLGFNPDPPPLLGQVPKFCSFLLEVIP